MLGAGPEAPCSLPVVIHSPWASAFRRRRGERMTRSRGLLFAQQRDRSRAHRPPHLIPSGLCSFQRQEGSPRDAGGDSPTPWGSTCHAAPLPKAPQAGPTAWCLRGQGARAGPPTQLAPGPRWISGNGSETQCDRMEILSTKLSAALYLWVLVAPLHGWMNAPRGDLGELSPHPPRRWASSAVIGEPIPGPVGFSEGGTTEPPPQQV